MKIVDIDHVTGEQETICSIKNASICDQIEIESVEEDKRSSMILKKLVDIDESKLNYHANNIPGFNETLTSAIKKSCGEGFTERLKINKKRVNRLASKLFLDPLVLTIAITEARYGTDFTDEQLLLSLMDVITTYSSFNNLLPKLVSKKNEKLNELLRKSLMNSLFNDNTKKQITNLDANMQLLQMIAKLKKEKEANEKGNKKQQTL